MKAIFIGAILFSLLIANQGFAQEAYRNTYMHRTNVANYQEEIDPGPIVPPPGDESSGKLAIPAQPQMSIDNGGYAGDGQAPKIVGPCYTERGYAQPSYEGFQGYRGGNPGCDPCYGREYQQSCNGCGQYDCRQGDHSQQYDGYGMRRDRFQLLPDNMSRRVKHWVNGRAHRFGNCGCASSGCDSSDGCDPCSRYFSTFGGWTDWYNMGAELSVSGDATGGASLDLQTKDGLAIGAALGRYLNEKSRSEMEFAYRNNSLGSAAVGADLNTPNPILPGGQGNVSAALQPNLDGRVQVYSGMYNLYHDFGSRCQTIRPYVGAGVGFAFINADVHSPALPGISIDVERSSFAYQGMAGIAYQWSNRIDLFAEYRVLGIDEFEATIAGPAAAASLDFGGMTHNVFMGARIAIR